MNFKLTKLLAALALGLAFTLSASAQTSGNCKCDCPCNEEEIPEIVDPSFDEEQEIAVQFGLQYAQPFFVDRTPWGPLRGSMDEICEQALDFRNKEHPLIIYKYLDKFQMRSMGWNPLNGDHVAQISCVGTVEDTLNGYPARETYFLQGQIYCMPQVNENGEPIPNLPTGGIYYNEDIKLSKGCYATISD